MKKPSHYTITDQFCGAGGSSLGAKKAAIKLGETFGVGIEVKLALNHWKLAIETHNTNFPDTDHDCTDVQACDPRRYPSTDMLVTSPECTKHSPAAGKKRNKYQSQIDLFGKATVLPSDERSRATMWDVPRFAEYHHYRHIIVENVVEAHQWVLFDSWLMAMKSLDYNHRICYLNSQFFAPCPQSRDRMYVVFWKKGLPEPDLNYRPNGFCYDCNKEVSCYQSWKNSLKNWGKYKTQYVYRCTECKNEIVPYYYAAFNAIDWSIPGKRIGDYKTPLSTNTLARIQWGIDKYGSEPLVITPRYSSGIGSRVRNMAEPLPTQPGDASHAFFHPFTITTSHTHAGPQRTNNILEPIPTQTSKLFHGLCLMPMIVENYGTSQSRPVTHRMAAITTSGKLGLVTDESLSCFLSYYYGTKQGSHITDSLGTIPTKDRLSLVYPKPKLEDCYYRMIKNHEAQRAMAFDDDYIILGNSEDKMKQIGNAVTPPVEEWLIGQCIKSVM